MNSSTCEIEHRPCGPLAPLFSGPIPCLLVWATNDVSVLRPSGYANHAWVFLNTIGWQVSKISSTDHVFAAI